MKKRIIRRGMAIALSLFVAINSVTGHGILPGLTSYADVERAAVVNATTLNVRSGAGTGYSIVDKLSNGTAVVVTGETGGSDGKVWYQIRFTGSTGAAASGYARSDYIRFPVAYSNDSDFEAYLSAQGFPESYKTGLRQLHAMYPNWVFTAQQTNLDWNTVIENESLVGRNLVYNGSISSWKSVAEGAYNWETSTWPSFDSGSYVAASSDLIRYYMDPRNFLDDKYVFQFLLHTYDGTAQTVEGLRSMVSGTFLEGSAAVSGEYGSSAGTSAGPGAGPGTGTGGPGSTGSSGVSTQGPGSGNSGNTGAGTQASGNTGNSGVSTQGPGSTGSSGVSTQAPGSTGSSGVSTQGPGGGNSGNTGAGTQAPGSSGSSQNSGSRGSVGFEAPGSVAFRTGGSCSTGILGSPGMMIDAGRLLKSIAPGMTSGPGGTVSSGNSSSGPGSAGSSGNTSSGPGGPGLSAGPGAGSSGSTAPTADYVNIIMNAGIQSGVNPYVLAAMIIQEQGTQGSSNSISGKVSGYVGYYNFFNIEAYRSGNMEATERGLWYASQSGSYGRPWNSIDKSISGGALYYGTNYVKVGQDTFYLKKFNVQGTNLYKHQYMTNVQAAASEGAKLSEAYSAQMKQSETLYFKIPVYLNMPETACAKPTGDGSPNNKLSALSVEGFALTPTFNRDTSVYDLIVNSAVTDVRINAAAYSTSAMISGTGNVSLQSGINEIHVSVKAQNGDVRDYVIRVVRQQNGPSYNSSLGSGVSGPGVSGPGAAGPGAAGPGASSGSGNSVSTGGPGAATSPETSVGPGGLTAGSTAGPGGTSSGVVSSDGPGSAGTGTSSGNANGPGGSNVTIVP